MTELRDVRLRQALDQAPDAGLQPPARVRDAIRAAAHGTVQPAWRRWWPAPGARPTPWLAAFASVLVASLVMVMWQGQEIPDARPEPQLADRQAPAAVPAPERAAANGRTPVAEATTPAPAIVTTPAPAAAPPVPALPPRVPAVKAPSTAAAKPPSEPPVRAAADALAGRNRGSAELRETARAEQAPVAAAPAADAAAPAAEALAKAAPPAPAPMAAPAPPSGVPAPAAAPPAAARFAASLTPSQWTQVRISAGSRTVLVPRVQADALPGLVTRLLAAPREPAVPAPVATLRLELETQGVLEWSEEGWRLLPQGDARRAQWLRVDESTSAALRAEAERLLGR